MSPSSNLVRAVAMETERFEEIVSIREGWRLNEIGKVDCRFVDPLALAIDDLLAEIARRGENE